MVWFVVSAVIVTGIAVLVVSNCLIDVTRYEINCDRDLKILHLSDLHKKKFGKHYSRLFEKINGERFDIICFTGDLISRSERVFDEKIKFMKRLTEIAPVYYIGGNHECDVPQSFEGLKKKLCEKGIHILENQTEIFTKDGENTAVSGLSPEQKFYKNEKGGYSGLEKITCDYLNEKLGKKGDEFTVLLAHSPFGFEEYAKWGADLTLCGHVHGGVVRLPFVKGVLSPERKFFPKFSAGKFKKDNCTMIVSRGLGKLRVLNSSEIVIITLKKEERA